MLISESLKEFIEKQELPEPIFNLDVSGSRVSFDQDIEWDVKFDSENRLDRIFKQSAKLSFSRATKDFLIDYSDTYQSTKNIIYREARVVLKKVIDSKCPERTKLYKNFRNTVDYGHWDVPQDEDKLVKGCFDLVGYYDSHVANSTDTKEQKDIHRKNILELFKLMEKRYGEGK